MVCWNVNVVFEGHFQMKAMERYTKLNISVGGDDDIDLDNHDNDFDYDDNDW